MIYELIYYVLVLFGFIVFCIENACTNYCRIANSAGRAKRLTERQIQNKIDKIFFMFKDIKKHSFPFP